MEIVYLLNKHIEDVLLSRYILKIYLGENTDNRHMIGIELVELWSHALCRSAAVREIH